MKTGEQRRGDLPGRKISGPGIGAPDIAPAGIAGSLTVFLFVLIGLGLYFVLRSW